MLITQERLKQLLHYSPDNGKFTWKVSGNGRIAGSEAGTITRSTSGKEYRVINVDGRAYLAGRLAYLYQLGEWPKHVVNHIDNDGTNNAWTNLEDIAQAKNIQHENVPGRGASGVRGVYWNEKAQRWAASYMRDGVKHFVGLFDTIPAAEQALIDHKAGRPVVADHPRYKHRR